jgi:hypothetical protein
MNQIEKEELIAKLAEGGWALEYEDDSAKADKDIVMSALKDCGEALEFASDALKADKEVVMAALQQSGSSLEFAGDKLKSDKDIVMAAMEEDGSSFEHASDALKADRDIVMAAIQESDFAFKFADDSLKADKDFMINVLQINGLLLEEANDALKEDKEVVMVALQQSGYSLQFANDALKADRDIVMAAIKKNGYSLQFASDALRADQEIIEVAVSNSEEAIKFAITDVIRKVKSIDIQYYGFQTDFDYTKYYPDGYDKSRPEEGKEAIITIEHKGGWTSTFEKETGDEFDLDNVLEALEEEKYEGIVKDGMELQGSSRLGMTIWIGGDIAENNNSLSVENYTEVITDFDYDNIGERDSYQVFAEGKMGKIKFSFEDGTSTDFTEAILAKKAYIKYLG